MEVVVGRGGSPNGDGHVAVGIIIDCRLNLK